MEEDNSATEWRWDWDKIIDNPKRKTRLTPAARSNSTILSSNDLIKDKKGFWVLQLINTWTKSAKNIIMSTK